MPDPTVTPLTIVTTTQVKPKEAPLRDLLIFDMAVREARRRSRRKNPPARFLVEVLDELGLKVTVAP
jgi:hypothetical protein